ncbi:MAG: hypothetical protein U0931_18055 [Vulcanimicrobiota bacterium]
MVINPNTPSPGRRRGLIRAGLENLGGVAGAALEVSNSLLPSLVAGVGASLRQGSELTAPQKLEKTQNVLNTLMWGQMGALALTYLAGNLGPVSVATTLFGKGVLGVALAGLYSRSGATRRLSENVQRSVEGLVDGSESTTRKVVEGAAAGLKAGLVDSARVGFQAGQGLAGGIWDGLSQLRLSPSLSIRWLHPVRLVGGLAGVALNTAVGAAQGFWQGVGVRATAEQHARLSLAQGVVLGGLLGVSGGWLGLGLGMAAGASLGWGAGRVNRHFKLDERWSRCTEATVELSQRQLIHNGEKVSDTYQNAIHGLMTGAHAGMRAGWRFGSNALEDALIKKE